MIIDTHHKSTMIFHPQEVVALQRKLEHARLARKERVTVNHKEGGIVALSSSVDFGQSSL